MREASAPLQTAQYSALTASALPSGAGVYDHVPANPAGQVTAKFPFVQIGEDQSLSDADQCHDPSTVFSTFHVYSRTPGKMEAKAIMAECLLRLDAALTIGGFDVIGHLVTDVQHLTDPDGITAHSIGTIRYRLNPTA